MITPEVPSIVENIQFGMGHYYYSGDVPLTPAEVYFEALRCGWSNGSPVTRELCNPTHTNYGPQKMLSRYSETNAVFQTIQFLVDYYNRKLNQFVFYDRQKRINPVGKYEPNSVPPGHMDYMAPMCTIHGYAMTRVMVAAFGEPYGGVKAIRASEIVEEFREPVKGCRSRDDLLIEACKLAMTREVEIPTILGHVFSEGWLEEENSPEDLVRLANLMEARTPELIYTYITMGKEEKTTLGIALI